MPLLRIFEIIENLFGFRSNEQTCNYRTDQPKRKLSEAADLCTNCMNKNIHSTAVLLKDSSIVSLNFVFISVFHEYRSAKINNRFVGENE